MKVSYVSIFVDDQIKARDFYTKILGFEVRTEINYDGIYWMTLAEKGRPDGAEISLEPAGLHQFIADYQATMFKKNIPQTAFTVSDIQAEYARLQELFVEFQSAPSLQGDVWTATFNDTCGNWIQLHQPKD